MPTLSWRSLQKNVQKRAWIVIIGFQKIEASSLYLTWTGHNTGSGKGYKPEFMAHFEKKENNKSESKVDPSSSSNEESASDATPNQVPENHYFF